ncbi:DUF1415 domain-containing protein [Aliidiomarina iranensis]|uniref:DUF1415 domain-containing protein n=1 Tax=Aliidiomarina iranensis TaxID=1434071 RepID=A0A432W0L9_9GAMM|nr:DUF1415 domain-containing protein [Aliidiomarina iranensis]RUO22565.1 DUF1415 domain-containing protein [Aliidiomarina iranensis]
MIDSTLVVAKSKAWVEQLIVKYNICPFARREVERDSIRYVVAGQRKTADVLEALIKECEFLDQNMDTETTLIMLPAGFEGFYAYLDLLDTANELLAIQGYEGIYQLASFHPDYCFEGEKQDAASNYTNRAPYPTLHLLREASLEQALSRYDDPESIPDRNIAFAEKKGAEFFEKILAGL